MEIPHIPVLKNEILEAFRDCQNGIFLDCTLGYAGHSSEILNQNKNLNLIACDRDTEAINFSTKRLEIFGDRVKIFKSKFSEILDQISVQNQKNIVGILADIGVSSLQIDKNERGFSINSDELDMRMDKSQLKDAKFVVNSYSEAELTKIFFEYGELVNAKEIAHKIALARTNKELTNAKELAKIIGENRVKGRSISNAILAFQAIRIEVNKELNELEILLDKIENSAINRAKIAIITFHSLEDRIVKNRFKKWSQSCICPSFALRCECGNNHAIGKIITKKAVVASVAEIRQNSRASCAKLRIFEINR